MDRTRTSIICVMIACLCDISYGVPPMRSAWRPESIEESPSPFLSGSVARRLEPGSSPAPRSTDDYQIDNGIADESVGLNIDSDLIWLNQFTVLPGKEYLIAVSLTWGNIPDGTSCLVLVYGDPNNDGNPSDAVLLASAGTLVTNSGTNIFSKVPINPTYLGPAGTSFFLGAYITLAANESPANEDTAVPVYAARSWVAAHFTPGQGDVNNLNNNNFPPEPVETVSGLTPGNWLLRGNALAAPPLGSCCDRGIDVGGGIAQCTDGVMESQCTGFLKVWKPVDCPDFDNTYPPCQICPDQSQLCVGAIVSPDPGCGSNFNAGCQQPPFSNFETLPCNQPVCGMSGNFGASDRDEDWFQLNLPFTSNFVMELTARFPAELSLMNNGGDPSVCTTQALVSKAGPACETLSIRLCSLTAGTWYVRVRPSVLTGVPCNSSYRLEARCGTDPFEQITVCCLADLNQDGVKDGGDIQKWVDTYRHPPTDFDPYQGCFHPNFCAADMNEDGQIDFFDLPLFVAALTAPIPPSCPSFFGCEDPARGQLPDQRSSYLSDSVALIDTRAAECFCPQEDGVVSTVCWWGTYLTLQLDPCPVSQQDRFWITFYRNNNPFGRCPGTPLTPPGVQLVSATRTPTGNLIGNALECFYTADLPIPVPVTAQECLWMEIVNDVVPIGCRWHWETASYGDNRHAGISSPNPGLPTTYNQCTPTLGPNVVENDLAFNIGVRIRKDGCGPPMGSCCYDAAPLGVIDCDDTTQAFCEVILLGEWSETASCPANCVLGRCCFLDLLNAPQCVVTTETTCVTLDRTSPPLSSLPGLWTAGITSCSGGNACPTGRCCIGAPPSCLPGVTEIYCISQGGTWTMGLTCASLCP